MRHKPKAGDRYWKRIWNGNLKTGRVLSTANGRVLFKAHDGQSWTSPSFVYYPRREFVRLHELTLFYGAKFAPAPRR